MGSIDLLLRVDLGLISSRMNLSVCLSVLWPSSVCVGLLLLLLLLLLVVCLLDLIVTVMYVVHITHIAGLVLLFSNSLHTSYYLLGLIYYAAN